MSLFPKIPKSNPPVLVRRLDTVEYFVDGSNGSDAGSRSGDRPEKPLLTIAEANDRCENGVMNIINVVAPGHVAETNPIVLDKQFVTVRGWPSQNGPEAQSPCTLVATVDDSYFTIAAQDVVVRDFTIHGGASAPTIDFNEVAWSFRPGIHNVTFKAGTWGIAMANAAADAFRADSPSHGWAITYCKFLPTLSAGGIYLNSNGSWGLIADNFFEYAPYGVYGHINAQMAGMQILRNRFMLPADNVVGNAIYLGNGISRGMVIGNKANDASVTGAASNPYFDALDQNAWFDNTVSSAGLTEKAPD